MNGPGASNGDLLVQARAGMLDALAALEPHREAVIVIGAQAVYLRTSAAHVALAEATKDSDLAVDPRELGDDPRLEEAMTRAGFHRDPLSPQPGAWLSPSGIPVDLMVPEAFAGAGNRHTRGARIPPHSQAATRRAKGLEGVLVDHSPMEVTALDPSDTRRYTVKVAGTGALLIAKLHKIAERTGTPTRLVDKDAHDIYRILIDIETDELVASIDRLRSNAVSSSETEYGLRSLETLFAAGPDSLGSRMAGRAEAGVGEPETVAVQVSLLASDLLVAIR